MNHPADVSVFGETHTEIHIYAKDTGKGSHRCFTATTTLCFIFPAAFGTYSAGFLMFYQIRTKQENILLYLNYFLNLVNSSCKFYNLVCIIIYYSLRKKDIPGNTR